MIGCCEVAIVGLVCHIIGLGIYAGYNIKIKAKEAELEKRTQELEKKNGSEQKQLNELKVKVEQLESKVNS
jgi:uncharacterized protein YlxW (UPF0749 family)